MALRSFRCQGCSEVLLLGEAWTAFRCPCGARWRYNERGFWYRVTS